MDPCQARQYKFIKDGKEVVTNGGKCQFRKKLLNGDFASYEKLQSLRESWVEKFIVKKKWDKKFGYSADHHYAMPKPEEFKLGRQIRFANFYD